MSEVPVPPGYEKGHQYYIVFILRDRDEGDGNVVEYLRDRELGLTPKRPSFSMSDDELATAIQEKFPGVICMSPLVPFQYDSMATGPMNFPVSGFKKHRMTILIPTTDPFILVTHNNEDDFNAIYKPLSAFVKKQRYNLGHLTDKPLVRQPGFVWFGPEYGNWARAKMEQMKKEGTW